MFQKDTNLYLNKTFSAKNNEYTLTIPKSEKSIIINSEQKNNKYKITYNESYSNEIEISNTNKIEVKVSSGDGENKVENI